MQVERKPSRWPYVGMLVVLLAACLLAPSYWQTNDETKLDGMRRGASPQSTSRLNSRAAALFAKEVPYLLPGTPGLDWIAATGLISEVNRWPQVSGNIGLNIAPPLTLDEFLVSLNDSTSAPLAMPSDGTVCTVWPATPGGSPGRRLETAAVAEVPGPLVTASLRWLGGTVAEYSPSVLGKWLGDSVGAYWARLANQPAVDADAASILPDSPGPLPSAYPAAEAAPPTEPVSALPWSVPDALFRQLARLAQDPYSAYWADHTISQLQALLQSPRYQCEETAAILAALSRSAETARQLAEQAGEDRMRVELLRAHWALARRIDCWKVMNNIRIATLDQARVAARGSLDSLLHDVPQRDDLESLVSELEQYETTRDAELAYRVALAGQNLAASPEPLDRALADAVEQHYRNANVRVAVTGEMVNRFVPARSNTAQPVWDRIAGTPVRGRSETLAQNRVRLEPATGRWQMCLESTGVVESNTLADGGRAQLRSYGATDFTAHKSVIVEADGVQMHPTVANVTNYNQLAGVTTDFDWVPFFSSLARNQAVNQYREKRPQAKAEIEWKVTAQVADRLDQEAADAVERVRCELRERITDPLAEGGVDVKAIELTTTNERLVARLRVAGPAQLGGHTPRPRALSDSLASLQVHETALTNAAAALGLDGERLSAPQLQARLREKMPSLRSDSPPEAREDTVLQFASPGAVQFRIGGGRFEIAVRVVEFQQDSNRIRNFIVHGYYVPVVNGLSAELVRDGALGIEGRISAGERARLYSVFNEVLGTERRLPVVKLENPADPRAAGLMITQFVLEDGWLGLAIGPDSSGRVAEQSRSLR